MSRLDTLETYIDTNISGKTGEGTVSPVDVGNALQAVAEYANPEGYSVYRAIINQSGSSAPTVAVLENTTGFNFTPSRSGAGHYKLTYPSGAIFEATTIAMIGQQKPISDSAKTIMYASVRDSLHAVDLWSWSVDSNGFLDDLMLNVSIELIVYP